MCEYCGCQALEAIATLTAEHDEALNHVRAAEKSLDAGDEVTAARACTDLLELLATHTAVEEQALFPALAEDFPEQIASLNREHELVEAALDEALTPLRNVGWERRLADALHVLRLHILKEQDGVFPAALGILSPAQWDHLEAVRKAQEAVPRLSVQVLRGVTEEAARA